MKIDYQTLPQLQLLDVLEINKKNNVQFVDMTPVLRIDEDDLGIPFPEIRVILSQIFTGTVDKILFPTIPMIEAFNQSAEKLSSTIGVSEAPEGFYVFIYPPGYGLLRGTLSHTAFLKIKQMEDGAIGYLFAAINSKMRVLACSSGISENSKEREGFDFLITGHLGFSKKGIKPHESFISEGYDSRNRIIPEHIVFLNFLRLVEVNTKVLIPKEKKDFFSCRYTNNTKRDVTLLNSTWFTTLVRSEAFKVRGHFRLQPCGPGMTQKKLIWIKDFEKSGYTAPARKLTDPLI